MFARTIYDRRFSLFIYILISVLLIWMLVAFFPSIHEQAEKFTVMFEAYPESFLKAFGVEGNLFSHFESFLAVENFSFMWPIILFILTLSLGSSAIAGEIEDGTIEFLLAQPISRAKIYLAKYFSGIVILLLFTFFSIYAVVPFSALHHVEIQLANYFKLWILGTFFGLCLFSITMMLSSMFSTKGKAASIMAGVLIFMYAVNLIANLLASLENIKYLSFFYYFDYTAVLVDNKLDLLNIAVFLGLSIICFQVGLVMFTKRDIAV